MLFRSADFGLLTIISDGSTTFNSSTQGTTRWMSPELFDPEVEDHRPTKWSDCYALGMVIYEVLSGHLPFYQFANRVVSWKVLRGNRPERPQGAEGMWFTDEVWQVLGSCWTTKPESRPSIEDVLQYLGKVSRSWKPPSPRSLAVLSTANSLTQELSDIITVESTDASDASPSSPLSEEPDLEESAGILIQVNYLPLIHRRIPDIDVTMLRLGSSPTLVSSALEPPIYLPDHSLTCGRIPAWKRLIDHPLTAAERKIGRAHV